MWKRSAEAWDTIANEWPVGGGTTVDVRRQALLGIFSFLGIQVDERDLGKVRAAGSEDIGRAMTKIEELLR
jgi:hypothetical protein